jgi:hypothetical protein
VRIERVVGRTVVDGLEHRVAQQLRVGGLHGGPLRR